MKKKHLLIVEDEAIVAMEIANYLSSLNYHIVATCASEKEVLYYLLNNKIDLILMDIFLEESNGIETALKIKKIKPNIAIIFLSASIDEETISKAITVNPEAYLFKPFHRQELAVAIRIALKHHSIEQRRKGNLIFDDEFSFDNSSLELICCGETIHLTKKERMLLILFLEKKNFFISILEIEYELWPDKPSNDSRRRSLISRLRAKLKHKFIETYNSEGYLFRI